MVGSLPACCARAASGHAAAAPPKSVMKSRRFIRSPRRLPLFVANRLRINVMALGGRLPTMHGFREHVEAGGLMSYGANFPDLFRRAADFVDKILRGAKPADLPVEQPTKFDLIVNLITARALGLNLPAAVLARADEVIE
jgi:ABC transporter substrate binding protein